MFCLSYVIVGIVLFLVNFNIGSASKWLGEHNLAIFQGQYTTFSVQWYRLVGSTLCFTLITYIVSTHIGNLAFALYEDLLMCFDRSCKCDRRHTKKLTQEDYEDANTGGYFEMEYKYSDMLFFIGVVFLYSAGMPVLYPIAAVFFFVGYWSDKALLLRFNRKPPIYDGHLARSSLSWFKWILLLHVVAGVIMFANSSIIPSKYVLIDATNDLLKQVNSKWQVEDFYQLHILIFVALFLVIVAVYLLWKIVVKSIWWCCKLCSDNYASQFDGDEELSYQWDFYDCASFTTLLNELQSCHELYKKINNCKATG